MKNIIKLAANVSAMGICPGAVAADPAGFDAAYNSITADALARHIEILVRDEFEGRAPGAAGETKTMNYLTEGFKKPACSRA